MTNFSSRASRPHTRYFVEYGLLVLLFKLFLPMVSGGNGADESNARAMQTCKCVFEMMWWLFSVVTSYRRRSREARRMVIKEELAWCCRYRWRSFSDRDEMSVTIYGAHGIGMYLMQLQTLIIHYRPINTTYKHNFNYTCTRVHIFVWYVFIAHPIPSSLSLLQWTICVSHKDEIRSTTTVQKGHFFKFLNHYVSKLWYFM